MKMHERFNLKFIYLWSVTEARDVLIFMDQQERYFFAVFESSFVEKVLAGINYNWCISMCAVVQDQFIEEIQTYKIIGEGKPSKICVKKMQEIFYKDVHEISITKWNANQ